MTLELTVLAAKPLTGRIRCIHLGYADGRSLPPAEPGAHVEVALQLDARTSVNRAYSVVNPETSQTYYEIAVQREEQGSGGSLAMHKLLGGMPVRVSAPRNNFALVADARHHVLIAGGIGITPILSMGKSLSSRGESFRLDYASRDRAEAAYVTEVEAFDKGACWFDAGVPGQGIDLRSVLSGYEAGFHAYVCGPKGLISAVVDVAREAGWPQSAVHYELFSGALEQQGDRTFQVAVEGTGQHYTVKPDQTMLEVLEAAGVPIMSDCRRGECGVCMTKVVRGVPDHRDASLSSKERAAGKLICPCVSRSLSDELVIQL